MAHPGQIMRGYTPVLDCYTSHNVCKFDNLQQKLDRSTGGELDAEPDYIKNGEASLSLQLYPRFYDGDSALVIAVPTKPLCGETFMDTPPLYRFSVSDMKQTVAVGDTKAVTPKQAAAPAAKKT